MNLQPIIGLEIHVQLKCKSKMFCGCDNTGENKKPNTCVCPVCMGHPGCLPVPNKTALKWALMAGLALDFDILAITKFDRKNYFYPDLPKGYQISQYDEPIGVDGHLIITLLDGKRKRIRLTRVHLEEDAAKLLHTDDKTKSSVDFNRAGTPLLEIVTEPDIASAEEAKTFLHELKLVMQYLNISDAEMEKGHLRVDANISLREVDKNNIPKSSKLLPKTEIKNLNSFKAVEKALTYEIGRQTGLWEDDTPPDRQSTRGWNEKKGVTCEQRSKEEDKDYRYFPEPDIPPIEFDMKTVVEMEKKLVELPDEKRTRFEEQLGLPRTDAVVLTSSRETADFFELTLSELRAWLKSETGKSVDDTEYKKLAKLTDNWITTELFKLLRLDNLGIKDTKITPENMAELIKMVYRKEINSSAGQIVLDDMFEAKDHQPDPSQIVEKRNLKQVSDAGELETIVDIVIKQNPKVVKEYKGGKENSIQFLIGQVMKESKGAADPAVAKKILEDKLK